MLWIFMSNWLTKPENYEECLVAIQEIIILMEKTKEQPKCPHCGNEDPSMIELLPHYKWDVVKDKIKKYICFVCSKEF